MTRSNLWLVTAFFGIGAVSFINGFTGLDLDATIGVVVFGVYWILDDLNREK